MSFTVGTKVQLVKGCNALEIVKGTTAKITEITPMGAEYSHSVRVTIKFLNGFKAGKTCVLWARHQNRLNDHVLRLNNGDPTKFVEIRERS